MGKKGIELGMLLSGELWGSPVIAEGWVKHEMLVVAAIRLG